MFGYATDEWDTETLHPYSHYLSNLLCEEMAKARHAGTIPWLRPDCKSQVIVEYLNEKGKLKPIRIYNILISTQHDPSVTQEEIKKVLTEQIINKVCPAEMLKETQVLRGPERCLPPSSCATHFPPQPLAVEVRPLRQSAGTSLLQRLMAPFSSHLPP